MGILLMLGVLLCIGIAFQILYMKDILYEDFWMSISVIVYAFVTLPVLIIIPVLWNVSIDEENLVILYQQDKVYIEQCYENKNITDFERKAVMEKIIFDNSLINSTKYWRDNFWVGWFYEYKVGDLQLFDINKIPPVRVKYESN